MKQSSKLFKFVGLLLVVGLLFAALPTLQAQAATQQITVCASLCDFTTIQAAIDASTTLAGATITVQPGTYTENVIVNKSVNLRGAQASIDPRSASAGGPGTRNQVTPAGETVVIPGIMNLMAGNIFTVQANNVTIDGFWIDGTNFDGANPSLTPGTGLTVGSTEVFAIHGIYNGDDDTSVYFPITGAVVQNNIVRNFADLGISVFNNRVSVSHDNLITHNFVTNLNGPGVYGPPAAISILYDGYSSVIENEVTNSVLGIYTENNHESVLGMSAPVISGNDVSTTRAGIWHNSTSGTAPAFTISDNIIRTWDAGVGHAGEYNIGLWLSTIMDTAQVNVSDNTIMPGAFRGIQVIWATAGVTIHGGSVSGARETGILVYNKASSLSAPALGNWGNAGQPTTVTLDGVSVSGSATGVRVWDNGGGKNVTMVLNGSSITGGVTGLSVSGSLASLTAKGNTISGNTTGINNLSNNVVDASGNWWGTADPATIKTLAGTNVDYTPWLDSGTDTDIATLGFQGDFSTLHVDDDSPQVGTIGRIQEGVNIVSGSTVRVEPGTYPENVIISKALTLLGAQAGVDARMRAVADSAESIVNPVGTAFHINATTGIVTIDGFKFMPSYCGVFEENGSSGHIIQNNIFSGITGGYGVNAKFNGVTLTHNRVENTQFGFEFNRAPGTNAQIVENLFTGNASYNINFIEGDTGIVISGNEQVNGTGNFAVLFKTTDAVVSGNTVTNGKSTSIFLGGGNTGTQITDNVITGGTSSAISISNIINSVNSNITVTGNILQNNDKGVNVSVGALTGTITVEGNDIIGNITGIQIGAPANAGIHFNRIFGNTTRGLTNASSASISATNNWWGCNAGPNDATAKCDITANTGTGTITSSPWLILQTLANPTSVDPSGTAAITANLRTNSANVDTSANGYLVNGLPVAFTTTSIGGFVVPTAASTLDGQATTTFTATIVRGTYDVCSIVDNQTTCAPMTVSNRAPNAVDDFYETDQDKTFTIVAPGVLTNDTDPDGDVKAATLVTNVSEGTLSLLVDGSFTYTPGPGFFGTDTFTYQLVTYPALAVASGWTDEAVVTITVHAATPPEGPPKTFYLYMPLLNK